MTGPLRILVMLHLVSQAVRGKLGQYYAQIAAKHITVLE
jgi:hypothetical protein